MIRFLLRSAVGVLFGVGIFSSVVYAFSVTTKDEHMEHDPWLKDAWSTYIRFFITAEGRVIDNANGNISHSEGQGYAMLIAARLNDQTTFSKVWDWTKVNLFVRNDGLPAWIWDPNVMPHNRDVDDATDGNLLIAWALAEGGSLWNRTDYTRAARDLATAVSEKDTAPSRFGPVLLPGRSAFRQSDRPDGPVVNLSYWVFPAFRHIERVFPTADWNQLISSGLSIIAAARFGTEGLPSDWISLAGGKTTPARGFARVFGYDAIRVPLYLAWGQPNNRIALSTFEPILRQNQNGAPSVIDLRSGTRTERLGGDGYKSITALLDCALNGTRFPKELLNVKAELYYPTTLHILSLIAARESYPQCLDS